MEGTGTAGDLVEHLTDDRRLATRINAPSETQKRGLDCAAIAATRQNARRRIQRRAAGQEKQQGDGPMSPASGCRSPPHPPEATLAALRSALHSFLLIMPEPSLHTCAGDSVQETILTAFAALALARQCFNEFRPPARTIVRRRQCFSPHYACSGQPGPAEGG
jgi:hypothetical protein